MGANKHRPGISLLYWVRPLFLSIAGTSIRISECLWEHVRHQGKDQVNRGHGLCEIPVLTETHGAILDIILAQRALIR